MPRHLDLTALRSFVTVAETGGVTKAAGFLHLTQSAVSMQLKRLEESLGLALLDRSSRSVSLTAAGEQLLSYARRMLDLNDQVILRMTDQDYEGELVLGVPADIVYPSIPQVLQRFNIEFPRVRVTLLSSYTRKLRDLYARGGCDMILTTEDHVGPGGETLVERPLIWIGAVGGSAWRQRPLRLAFEKACIFRPDVQKALDAAGVPWDMAVESESSRTVEASVSADLAVHAAIEGTEPPYVERIAHNGGLPTLPRILINFYTADPKGDVPKAALAALVRQAYRAG
ncbi:LysR family transcriptional regulator [Palleronia sp. KMU-117]|uniref:LysR family transcriptional regulator n=1 Tax=Palleronia sp. KMU-117 TaxID=3434108 RepID=UPI003D70F499